MDANANGMQDDGEAALAGVTVYLDDNNNSQLDSGEVSVLSGADGSYTFADLAAGSYVVRQVVPAGYEQTTPLSGGSIERVSVSSDGTQGDFESLYPSISDDGRYVSFESSADNLVPGDTNGMRDILVYDRQTGLIQCVNVATDGTQSNNVSYSPSISDDGRYVTVLNTGMADLTTADLTVPEGYLITEGLSSIIAPGEQDTFTVTLSSSMAGTFAGTISFTSNDSDDTVFAFGVSGTVTAVSSISGIVWEERVFDYLYGASDVLLEGFTVELYSSDSQLLASTVTDAQGAYSFTGLDAGDYYLDFVHPMGRNFIITNYANNSYDDRDNDASQINGQTEILSLSTGQDMTHVDAGYLPNEKVTIDYWLDENANGIFDEGESSIAGVQLVLTNLDLSKTVTSTTGDYTSSVTFKFLAPGEYQLSVVLPDGYALSAMNVGSDNTVDSDVDPVTLLSAQFTVEEGVPFIGLGVGLMPVSVISSISGTVWDDADANGVQDAGELGVASVTVNLLDDQGSVIGTTVSDSNGAYTFADLVAGDYQVEFQTPAGYVVTYKNRGSDDTVDSDLDVVTGRTEVFNLSSGELNDSLDGGMISERGVLVQWTAASGGNDHWYELLVRPAGLDWSEARDLALTLDHEGLSGHLATLGSSAENDFVSDLLIGFVEEAAWIGGFEDNVTGWQWDTGEAFNYTNWSGSQPDNADGGQDYIGLQSPGNYFGLWDDRQLPMTGLLVEYSQPSAPVQWSSVDGGNDHYYQIVRVPSGLSWESARDAAAGMTLNGMTGHLVTIGSQSENDFIDSLTSGSSREYYTGGFQSPDASSSSVGWQWVTGETFDFENWHPGEPNDSGPDEDYLGFRPSEFSNWNGQWNDTDNQLIQYIVEFEPEGDGVSPVTVNASDIQTLTLPGVDGWSFNSAKDLSWHDGALWMTTDDYGWDSRILKLDVSGDALSLLEVGDTGRNYTDAITWLNDRLWSGDQFSNVLDKHDDNGGYSLLESWAVSTLGFADGISGLGTDGTLLYASGISSEGYMVVSLNVDGATPVVVDSYQTTHAQRDIVWDGTSFWTVEANTNLLRQWDTQWNPLASYSLDAAGVTNLDGLAYDGSSFYLLNNPDGTSEPATVFKVKNPNATGSISGVVWSDINGNGVADSGESALGDVTVNLLDGQGSVVGTTVSDSNGVYTFADLLAGDYQVEFTLTAGYQFSPQDVGTDDSLDSDADTTTGRTTPFTLADSQALDSIDAGLTQEVVVLPSQEVYSNITDLTVLAGGSFQLPILYDVSNGDNTLDGLGLRIHYDSGVLTWDGFSEVLSTSQLFISNSPQADINDYDNDPSTDMYVRVVWQDFSGQSQWPNSQLPLELMALEFTLAAGQEAGTTTTINITDQDHATGYDFVSTPVTITSTNFSFDIDGNGQVRPLSDGVLMLRYLWELPDEMLQLDPAVSGATRTTPEDIKAYLDAGMQAGAFDIDGNGQVRPLSDGVMLLRYLWELPNDQIPMNPSANGATRTTVEELVAFMDQWMPHTAALQASADALLAMASSAGTGDVLTDAMLRPILEQAIAYWQSVGLDASQLEDLSQVNVRIDDLPGVQLGQADGYQITIDSNAGGLGWFIDQTPGESEEFVWDGQTFIALQDSAALGRMDLLSAVAHELGHAIGLRDVESVINPGHVMGSELNLGERHLPSMDTGSSLNTRLAQWGSWSLTNRSDDSDSNEGDSPSWLDRLLQSDDKGSVIAKWQMSVVSE
jgi:hypothetical protein